MIAMSLVNTNDCLRTTIQQSFFRRRSFSIQRQKLAYATLAELTGQLHEARCPLVISLLNS